MGKKPKGADSPRMKEILRRCEEFSAARRVLAEVVDKIREAQRKIVKENRRALESRTARVSAAKGEIENALMEAHDLFASPKSITHEGVKAGWRKKPGAVKVQSEARAIARIHEMAPDLAPRVIKIKETLDKKALRDLPAKVLAGAGVTILAPFEESFVSTPKDDLDAITAALMGESDENV